MMNQSRVSFNNMKIREQIVDNKELITSGSSLMHQSPKSNNGLTFKKKCTCKCHKEPLDPRVNQGTSPLVGNQDEETVLHQIADLLLVLKEIRERQEIIVPPKVEALQVNTPTQAQFTEPSSRPLQTASAMTRVGCRRNHQNLNSSGSKHLFKKKSNNYDPGQSLQIADLSSRLEASISENEKLKTELKKLNKHILQLQQRCQPNPIVKR